VKAATTPTLRGKLVMPHAVRHATAVRLISAGVASPSSAAGSAM
jgi:site-specific recombinase XerD